MVLIEFLMTGAKQPIYLVTADDVDTYLAIEVQPLDDRKRKVYAYLSGWIACPIHIFSTLHMHLTLPSQFWVLSYQYDEV